MAKNEAKIKFTAETGEFNESIQQANREMSELRAELKLNETQMKGAGASAETLEKKHEILEKQLEVSQEKTEALNKKLQKAVEIFGENSQEASKLKVQLLNAQTAEEKLRQAVSNCETELDQQETALKDAGGAAEDSAEGFDIAKGAIADLAADAIQAAIGKVTEFIDYLKELPEATREIRQDMATLETSFEKAGFSVEQGTQTWKELYAIFGEDDRAVEAANLIAKMADSQEDLNEWVTITTGIWGTYQDSLPVEGLAEASMETAKTGQVTGVLADALNWSSEAATMFADYMSEDVTTAEDAFNEALKECTTEEERQALITETLTALYGDAAKKYEEASGAQMDAKEATADNILVQNELADTLEPVTTAWQEMKTEGLESLQPVIEKVSGAMLDAMEWMKEHPVLMKAVGAAVGVVTAALGALIIVVTAYTVAQWAMNSAILANPITWIIVGAVAAVAALVAAIILIVEYWDEIVEAVKDCWKDVKKVLSQWGKWIDTKVIKPVAKFFKNMWNGIVTAAKTAWDGIKNAATKAWNGVTEFFSDAAEWFNVNVIEPIVSFFEGLWDSIQNIWDGICEAVQTAWDGICNVVSVGIQLIGSIIDAAVQIITLPFMFIWENCKEYVFAAWEWIKTNVSNAITKVKTTISTVMDAIKKVFSTVWDSIKNTVSTVWNAIKTKISDVVNAVKSVVSKAWDKVKSVTTTVFDSVKSAVSKVWNAIKDAVTKVVNAVKDKVSSIWNSIKTTTSTVFNSVKSVVTTVWNGIKTKITDVVNAVKTKVTNIWNSIKTTTSTVFNSVKSVATTAWNGVKTAVSKVVNGIKTTVSGVWNGIKSTTSSVFNSVKSTASSVWNGIKSAITTPIENAKNTIKGIVDTIKGFFSNMNITLPHIKMPHFSITPAGWTIGDLLKGSIPRLSISWYKDGGIMMKPTLFGINGNNLMAGGEAGPEAILPIDRLEGYISSAIEKSQNTVNLNALAAAIEDLANRPVALNINGRQFAYATASDTDSVGGMRSTFKSRGLAVE